MKIEKMEIRYAHKNGNQSTLCNKLQHIKTLPWLSLVQSQEGSYGIQLNDGPLCQTGDGGFFIAPSQVVQNITHYVNPDSHTMRNRWIFVDVVINDRFRLDSLYDFPLLIPKDMTDQMNNLFDKLFTTDNICDEMSIYYQIIKLLLQIAMPKNLLKNKTILCILDYIQEHYTEDISMTQLAKACHISESYLYEVFKKNIGTPPLSYINYYRLSLASELLKQTDSAIYKIAESVGIHDVPYFTRLFRRTFGMTPRAYRKDMSPTPKKIAY